MNHQLIEINKLSKSPLNARRTVAKGAADDLKASILAHGLMQNLVVTEGGDGTYRVIEGARRLEALKALQKDGKLPELHTVACQVVSEETALEKSLAANTVRLAMHPADEFAAFAKLAEAGDTPGQVAERFGVTAKHVEQRLKLGNADPKLLKEYREGNMTLDCLMAFAITDDRKRQMKVYRSLLNGQRSNPRAIRAALTETMAEADSKLAKFVGLDAYRDAGGTTQSDLFSDAVYLENPELLNDLVAKKLDGVRQQLQAEGWGWIEISQERDWDIVSRCGKIHPLPGEVPQEILDRKAQVENDLAGIEDALEGTESDELINAEDYAKAELEAVEEKISAFAAYDPDHVRIAGCYVSIEHDGGLRIDKGLVKKQDMKRLETPDGATEKKPKGMPATLKRDVQAYRLQIAQLEVARNRLVALDLLIFTIASDAFQRRLPGHSGLDVVFRKHSPAAKAETVAGNALEATQEALPLAWLEATSEAEQFRLFSYLPDADKVNLLAYCVASSLKPRLGTGNGATAYEVALSLTGADVAAFWRPTAANYLGRITRDQLLTIGREILGESWAQSRHKDKKSELAAQLERAFAAPEKHGRTPEQVGKLSNWLPEGMAFTATAAEQPKAKKKNARKAA
jgi:ParB family transcriptional regulator, chromosome partitioning protein